MSANTSSRERSTAAEVRTRLETFDWPGNVRQLQNVLKYALIQATGNVLTLESLPEDLRLNTEIIPSSPPTVRQFFGLANRHIRWELNDLARRLVGVERLMKAMCETRLVGCNQSPPKDKMPKMEMDKMKGDKMEMDKMKGDKMKGDKVEGEKIEKK